MFRRRRRRGISIAKVIGLMVTTVGIITLIYILPFQLWALLFACLCIVVGGIIFRIG